MEEIRPRIRVAGILIENDKILLIQHYKNNKKYWLIPGGGNDWGETAKEALIREYKEETNMDIEVDEFLFFSETIYPNKERHILNLFFRIHRNEKNDSIIKLGDEAVLTDLKFVTKEELETLNEDNVKEIMLHLAETPNKSFVVKDAITYWEKNIAKDKNEEKKNEVLSNLRKFILNSMINGKIKFYCSENEIVPYEENKVYIPEKFRNYIRTLIIGEGAGVVGIANSRNEIINDLNDVDVIVADILSEPKTEKEIIEKLSKTAIYRTMPDGERKEVEASEYLPESIRKFEFLGYFSKR